MEATRATPVMVMVMVITQDAVGAYVSAVSRLSSVELQLLSRVIPVSIDVNSMNMSMAELKLMVIVKYTFTTATGPQHTHKDNRNRSPSYASPNLQPTHIRPLAPNIILVILTRRHKIALPALGSRELGATHDARMAGPIRRMARACWRWRP
jgi:hypothetical protein